MEVPVTSNTEEWDAWFASLADKTPVMLDIDHKEFGILTLAEWETDLYEKCRRAQVRSSAKSSLIWDAYTLLKGYNTSNGIPYLPPAVVSYGYEKEDVIFEMEYKKGMRELGLCVHFFPSRRGGDTLHELRVGVCYTCNTTCVSYDVDGYYKDEDSWYRAISGIKVFVNAAHELLFGDGQQLLSSKD